MNKRSIVGFIEVLNFLVNALVHFIISCLLPGKAPMLMVNTILFFRDICINIKFNSQRTTNMTATTSHANQKYQGLGVI